MKPFIKLGIGAVLLGVGFVVSMQAQRELIDHWAKPCEDCDDEEKDELSLDEEIKSFVDVHTEDADDNG
jgi:hypothetical protein